MRTKTRKDFESKRRRSKEREDTAPAVGFYSRRSVVGGGEPVELL